MNFLNLFKTKPKTEKTSRMDGFTNEYTGKGTNADKLSGIKANRKRFSPKQLRDFYISSGFIQNIVNCIAEDSMREWITIKTNRDEDLNIARLLENRLIELSVPQKLEKLVRYSRIYNEGALLYLGCYEEIPNLNLDEPIDSITKIEYLNVLTPDNFQIVVDRVNPLSKNFNEPKFYIAGQPVHDSRIEWLCNSFMPEESMGISIIQTVLDAIYAQDSALWSITSLLEEMAVTVFKSPLVGQMNPKDVGEFLRDMKMVMNTQSVMALSDGEDLTKKTISIPGIKEIFDFIFDNLSGLSKIPKSRLMGQAQGTITSGQYDTLSYYDTVSRYQENTIKPILEKLVGLVVNESSGDIYRLLKGKTDSLDWEISFNPLWQLGPTEEVDRNLKEAQRDQIYLTTGVVSPDDIRNKRFHDLEDFGISESLSFVEKEIIDETVKKTIPATKSNIQPAF